MIGYFELLASGLLNTKYRAFQIEKESQRVPRKEAKLSYKHQEGRDYSISCAKSKELHR